MDIPLPSRFDLIRKVLEGEKPRYRQTQPGNPVKQKKLLAELPAIHLQHTLMERTPTHNEGRG